MAKGFSETNGSAKKGGEYYKWVDGDQTLRLVGDIVPRYVYWKKTPDGKNISIECLSFDRDLEKFTNIEKDWFKELLDPDNKQNCSWAYVARALVKTNESDEERTKLILIPMKKKLYQQIIEVAKELGDPTDVDKGWDLIINRAKTGNQAFNVEYTLKQLRCKPSSLTDGEKAIVAEMPSIDELVPRPTAEEQKEYITKMFFGVDASESEVDEDAASEVASDL